MLYLLLLIIKQLVVYECKGTLFRVNYQTFSRKRLIL
nr:MAG TPA: hypothetical protein [Caudoviricetes sp.]